MAEGASPAVDTYRRFPGSLTVPEEWFDYTRYGEVIPGTRIIAVKTPLKKEFNNGRPQSKSWTKYDFGVCTEDEFTPQQLMDALTDKGLKLSAIIDLTYTNRYYSSAEFEDAGVTHIKIKCPGKVVPSDDIYCRFASALKESLNSSDDPRTVVAVHCTHGVNRTGYLLCRYLMQEKSFTADRAIRKVQEARGHVMKKYLEPLRKRSPSAPSRSRPPPPQETRPPHQHHNAVHRKHPRSRPSPHKPQECTHPHHTKETGHLNRGWDRRRGRSDNDTNWRAPPLTQQGVSERGHWDCGPAKPFHHSHYHPFHTDYHHVQNPYPTGFQSDHNPYPTGFQPDHNPYHTRFHDPSRAEYNRYHGNMCNSRYHPY